MCCNVCLYMHAGSMGAFSFSVGEQNHMRGFSREQIEALAGYGRMTPKPRLTPPDYFSRRLYGF